MLGILDWGIGGIGFYALLRAKFPQAPVTYLSDSGATPYGKMAPDALGARVSACARELAALGVTRLAVACNAASTVIPAVEMPEGQAITGVIEHGIAAVRALRKPGVVGVIGGKRTIRSGAYRRGLASYEVRQRIAQPLSAYIEAGDLSSTALRKDLRRIMAPLRSVDTLVLACTHYPALAPAIQAEAPDARLVDPAASMLRWVERAWQEVLTGQGTACFLTSGDPKAMQRAAAKAFGVEIAAARLRRR